ncbi:SHOCT domain-containing protein [Brevibacterium sp. H602]|uniref:SHOCT domain-containing protein n=1 Tax=unclassified Brevibacterium TaxID=2614124 RepID=UPI00397B4717
MGQSLAHINKKIALEIDDAGTHIQLVRKGEVKRSWALTELAQIRTVAVKSFWASNYVRFIRRNASFEGEAKYSAPVDPDAVDILDEDVFRSASEALRELAERHGIEYAEGPYVPNPDKGLSVRPDHVDIAQQADVDISVRAKSGREILRWSNSSIYVRDHSVEYRIEDLESIRVFMSTFGISYIQLVPSGQLLSWPDYGPVEEFSHTYDLDEVWRSSAAMAAFREFRNGIEAKYPHLLIDLKKRRNRRDLEDELMRRTAEVKGEAIELRVVPIAIAFLVYPREIWTGPPFQPSSQGGSLEGVRASYSVSGNHLMQTRTKHEMIGTTHIHKQVDMRQFQMTVEGPDFSITRTWASQDGATDQKMAEMVNVINEASRSFTRSKLNSDTLPHRPTSPPTNAGQSPKPESEQLRRLTGLYSKNLITEDEFLQARKDLENGGH